MQTVRVLLVEDDEDDQFLTTEALNDVEATSYEVTWVTTVDEAIAELRRDAHDVALLDFRLGAGTGLDVLAGTADVLHPPCILLTGQRDRQTDLSAMEAGAADYLLKGELSAVSLERSIRYAIEREEHVRSVRESELRFRAVVEAATDAILLADDDGRLITWNRAALALFGLDEESAARTELSTLLGRTGRPTALQELIGDDGLVARRSDATTFPAALSMSSWTGGRGRLWSVIVRDITGQRELEGKLVHQAFHDPLTGLANRALFANRVEHAIVRLQRNPGALGVLFIDLDDFKRINDSMGHAVGDSVLVAVSERLRGCVRSNDTIARLGGDEFAVLVEDADDPKVAFVVADRITRAMQPSFDVGDREIDVSCSIGISVTTSDDVTGSELLRDADVAMYAAKAKGKNCVELFEDRMHTVIMDRVRVEDELRHAVDNDEIEAFFQPILDLATGRLKGFEALARWRHPVRGLLSPAVFINVAEANGQIVPIGKSILEQACSHVRRWQLQYPETGELTVSVNLSGRQLDQSSIVETVADALTMSGLPASCLVLEITESIAVSGSGPGVDRLTKIAELGVGLAMDDFGTGFSSLSYLHHLPLTALKVDRSFVDRIDDQKGGALVEAIVAMSHSLGLQTIAEGIETAGQLEALTKYGCVYGQGFLFARPLSVRDVDTLLGGALARRATSASVA